MIFSLLSPLFKKPEYRVRIFYLIYIGVTVVSILVVFFDLIENVIAHTFYLVFLLLIIVITFFYLERMNLRFSQGREVCIFISRKILFLTLSFY
jgi:hypothetical protein